MDKDITALSGFLQRANELQAPEECQSLKQEYTAMLQEECAIMERIKRALINRDWIACDVAFADLDTFYNGLDTRVEASLQGIFAFCDAFSALIDIGDALRDKIRTGVSPPNDGMVSWIIFHIPAVEAFSLL
ncbi:MAG: hypothetical protein C4536_09645 [Actinobacteria bacterium]|jgi:hypothetical protein|nr:MAG: hypothetical protein C4536_09645 [Actinomycetota bacterium]